MEVIEKINEIKTYRLKLTEPIGFVPTMGYLHQGHLSLIRRSRAENLSVVISIFVNPTQFSSGEDFDSYPRDTECDLALLEKEGADVVFMPSAREIYPPQFDSWVVVDKLAQRLEGANRPGHFRGVATVCAKLFNIVKPTRAYFGQKDAQQVAVIKKMISDLNMNLKIITLPTVRESDGLAISSRNSYLNHKERQAATILYRALTLTQKLWSEGERDAHRLRQEMTSLLKKEPLVKIDYVSIADRETLNELTQIISPALASLAVKIGSTRLIDNIVLK
ncbi:MAG: pantoate--beta-alanine ligase [Dehalococcoidales bacterium]|jgi:pantoate--beta-alanine ligase|nr:pantoate--beta-alanine ligase [Dehalococcoidales bacterium]